MGHVYEGQRCIFCNVNELDVYVYEGLEECIEREPYVYQTSTVGSQSLVVNILPYAIPSARRGEEVRFESLVDTWRTLVPDHLIREEDDADYEDFCEQAARLRAADKAVLGNLYVTFGFKDEETYEIRTGKKVSLSDPSLQSVRYYGMVPSSFCNSMASIATMEDYWAFPEFHKYAGRDIAVCSNGVEGRADILEVLEAWRQEGKKKAFIKATTPKTYMCVVYLEDCNSSQDIHDQLSRDGNLGWGLVYNEGRPNAWLVQEYVEMRHERRFFVVDDTVVTSAGCIEEFTPIYNTGLAHDTKTREVRGSNEYPKENYDVLTVQKELAEKVAAELRYSGMRRDYVVDIALRKDGSALVVEFNSLWNSGLYASSPLLVVKAILDAPYAMTLRDVTDNGKLLVRS